MRNTPFAEEPDPSLRKTLAAPPQRETLLPATRTTDHEKLTWTRLRRAALSHFGVRSFRRGQTEILEAIFHGRDVFGVLPTGAGKSLCYQLPGLFLPKPTLVISPLLSLMRDQEEHLRLANVPVTRVDSSLTAGEAREAEWNVLRGSSRLLYATPERLEDLEYVAKIGARGVSLVVVDEAHCASQWGHDFRPAYLSLARAFRLLGRPQVMALTATATPKVTAEVIDLLEMDRPVVVRTGIARKNVSLEVVRTPNDEAKKTVLMERARAAKRTGGVGLVYAATIAVAEEVCAWLKEGGLRASCYHGRLPTVERRETQERFMADEFDVVVATNAFGLGIDKPDVRYVIHYNFPDSLERYYQEAGRAGRDGLPARATLLYRLEDRRIQTSFLGGKYPRRDDWGKVFEALPASSEPPASLSSILQETRVSERRAKVILAELESTKVVKRREGGFRRDPRAALGDWQIAAHAYETRLEDDRERIAAVMRYAQSTECRATMIARYFGEDVDEERCGNCDNCKSDAARTSAPAPRTAPPPAGVRQAPSLAPGTRVSHPKFGAGKVIACEDERVAVQFEDAQRTVRISFFGEGPDDHRS